jgi:mannosyltransferase OCH1-like enzyme
MSISLSTQRSLSPIFYGTSLCTSKVESTQTSMWRLLDPSESSYRNHSTSPKSIWSLASEVDEPDFASHPVLGSKAQSFCQWKFMCKPRLPVILRLIENIMKWLHELSLKQGKPISDLYLDFNEVLSGTGPSAFTAAILAGMSKTVGQPVAWDNFHGLTEAKLVGGVLVLTVEAFAAGTGHSDSGNHGGKAAMVRHHFHAGRRITLASSTPSTAKRRNVIGTWSV